MNNAFARTRASFSRPSRIATRRGVTLIDVLVTLAVVTLLIGLMIPALGPIRETARRLACQSNERQIGIAMLLYAEDNSDILPSSVFVPPAHTAARSQASFARSRPWDTMALRAENAVGKTEWDGLGLLYAEGLLPTPEVFYCPSHRGVHRFEQYQDEWLNASDRTIFGNYQYRAQLALEQPILRLSRIQPTVALASDGLRTQDDINHKGGVNVLRADHSVSWFADTAGIIASALPATVEGLGDAGTDTTTLEDLWRTMDE